VVEIKYKQQTAMDFIFMVGARSWFELQSGFVLAVIDAMQFHNLFFIHPAKTSSENATCDANHFLPNH
jgi:hypothetical protein